MILHHGVPILTSLYLVTHTKTGKVSTPFYSNLITPPTQCSPRCCVRLITPIYWQQSHSQPHSEHFNDCSDWITTGSLTRNKWDLRFLTIEQQLLKHIFWPQQHRSLLRATSNTMSGLFVCQGTRWRILIDLTLEQKKKSDLIVWLIKLQ